MGQAAPKPKTFKAELARACARLSFFLSAAGAGAIGVFALANHSPNGGDRPPPAATADAPAFSQLAPQNSPAVIPDLAAKPAVFDDTVAQTGPHKPIIMIDPGHGGIDPGAVGAANTVEKTVVLAVATYLKSALDASGRFTVIMTRDRDVFVPLDERVELSRRANADIFLSLHADTIDDRNLAQTIRGASVYTLSEKASNEDAQRMAEKENAADLAAGADWGQAEHADDVKPILFDLLARETATFSHVLSHALVTHLATGALLTREPERSAAFRVLRQPHAPSVLIELGFLSNAAEEQQMAQAAWQQRTAGSIAAAIRAYFEQKSSGTAAAASSTGGLPP